MARKRKNSKKRKSLLKRISLAFSHFVFRHKIFSLLIVLSLLVFGIIRKEEIVYVLKDNAIRIISLRNTNNSMKAYDTQERQYLSMLKEKYSGYGRKITIDEAKKAIEDACNYIAKVEGNDFWTSLNAKDLLLATAITESDLRARYSQYGGNAVGIFQIEYITFNDFWKRSLPKSYPKLYKAMLRDFGDIDFEMLQNDDMLSAIFARLVYSRAKVRIPYRNDVKEQANYYKKYYNTHLGKAKSDTFIKKKNSMHKMK